MRRALAPLRARRHGYAFIGRRVVVERLKRGGREHPVPSQFELIPFDALARDAPVAHEVHPRQQIFFDPLSGLDPWLEEVSGWGVKHRIPPQRVVHLRDAIVFGTEGWVGPAPGAVCAELGNSLPRTPAKVARAAGHAFANGVVTLEGTTASLLQLSGGSYFHWMTQGVPRLSLVLDAVGVSAIDRFLVEARAPAFVFEVVERAGIPSERLLMVEEPARAYRSERLVAATMLPIGAPTPGWATAFVRGLFADSLRQGGQPLLYVGRGSGRRRRLVNEDRVLEVLEPFGFRPVTMDSRTVADQAALFAGARFVVAPHGAALTNLLFAAPSMTVLELLGANVPSAVYAVLARQTGLRYEVLVGSEPRPPRSLRTWIGDADMVVDPARLVGTVATLLDNGGG